MVQEGLSCKAFSRSLGDSKKMIKVAQTKEEKEKERKKETRYKKKGERERGRKERKEETRDDRKIKHTGKTHT